VVATFIIFSEVAPRPYNRYPQHCPLSEERKPIRNNIEKISAFSKNWGYHAPGGLQRHYPLTDY